LWFDDKPEFYESLNLEPFKASVRSWGFVPRIEFVSTPAAFNAKDPNQYDLIVVDFNLGDDQHGEDFIKRVRENRAYTEIVFYSAQAASDLWAAIGNKKLEGVFVSNQQGIVEKLERVAHQSVHKVLDLNNMRGMVMAEVGDIDLILENILQVGLPGVGAEHQTEIFAGFHERAHQQSEQTRQRLEQFKAVPTLDVMRTFMDSYKRWTAFRSLIKRHPAGKQFRVSDYNTDVLVRRNNLAHGTPEKTATGYLFRHEGKEYLFDEAESLALRTKILDYKEVFQGILKKLSEGA
jgi:CheY-like chemotaxis protein